MVQFHQNAKGVTRGAMFHITGRDESGNVIGKDGNGRTAILPLKQPDRFQVFEPQSIKLAKGEQIRLTRNGESLNGRRLNNGNLATIEKFKKNGNIILLNGAELSREHGHFTYGYCQTSHSSQSKSVRHVLVAQSAKSFVASSREQFYVSVSRGKESIRIYTDDLRGLQEAVGISSTRLSGIELAGLKAKDLAAMGAELQSREWRDAIKSRKTAGATENVKTLLKERRQDTEQKGKNQTWRQYVEMRRGLIGPDGKSRSKGHPQPPAKGAGSNLANKRRSFLRPTELSAALTQRMKTASKAKSAAPEKTPAKQERQPDTRAKRVAKALKSSAENFRKSVQRRKTSKPLQKPSSAPKTKLKPSSHEQAAKHSLRQRAAEANRGGESRKQTKAKTQTAVPRPPAPRK